jgi:hypothetical protein
LKIGLSAPTNNNEIITKEYVDTAVNSIDLSDYATKEYVDSNEPDLSNCITKSDMFFECNTEKDIRIKYNSTPVDAYNNESNIYIGGNFNGTTSTHDYHSVVIGLGAKNTMFKNVWIGNNSQVTSAFSTELGFNAKVASHSTAIGAAVQASGACSISIGSNCINSTDYHLKFWAGAIVN